MFTPAFSTPSRGRRFALGAVAVVTVGLVSAFASATGAQPVTDPIVFDVVSIDAIGERVEVPDNVVPAISDTAAVVAHDTVDASVTATVGETVGEAAMGARRVFVRDRVGETSRPVGEVRSAAPGISGNGCFVAYSVFGASDVTLTLVDRCGASSGGPSDGSLPIGAVLDTVGIAAGDVAAASVAAPALSFDGSTVVWSTGREIRRYVRTTASAPYERTNAFDVVANGSPDAATGTHVDVSADGLTVVFVAGPGTTPFGPSPSNVHVWTAATSQADPELLSSTSVTSAVPGASDSTAPTISADGSFVVFESTAADLAVVGSSTVLTPFVVGVDRTARTGQILVDDAGSPAVSADGNHVVYRRNDAIRVLSSDATTTADVGIDELAAARPPGGVAISRFGRWLVFAGASDLAAVPATPVQSRPVARTIWAVDRNSSRLDVVDTTVVPTTTPTTTSPNTPTTTPATPSSTLPDVASQLPPTTSAPSPIVPRFPTVTGQFPIVGIPRQAVSTPPPDRGSRSSFLPVDSAAFTAFATSVTFEPTVVDAGRRTRPVSLTNATARTLQVFAASIELPDVFTIASDGCSGLALAPGASCTVAVQFAPITVGRANAAVAFRLSDGTVVTATLEGEGVPEPTLDLVPAVAGAGQTVTVFGAGFAPGSTVELSQPGSSTTEPIVVGANGTFAHVVVVLPNTLTGPAVLAVNGQPDAFDDVTADLLVSSRGATSGDAALRGGLAGSLGR